MPSASASINHTKIHVAEGCELRRLCCSQPQREGKHLRLSDYTLKSADTGFMEFYGVYDFFASVEVAYAQLLIVLFKT